MAEVYLPNEVWSLLFKSHATDINPCNISTLEMEFSGGIRDFKPGLMYVFRTDKYCGSDCVVKWSLYHSSGVSASQRDSSQGRESLSSAAFMQRD